jgi:hypothetical protein
MKRCFPWPAPSLLRLRQRLLFFVRLVHRYYGAVRLLRSVRVCLVALCLRRPASLPCGPRRSRGLPVLVHVVSQRARGLRLRRTDGSLAIIANHRGAFLHRERVGVLVLRFSTLNTRPTDTPVYASSHISRCLLQDSGPRWVAFCFLVGLFHSLVGSRTGGILQRFRLSVAPRFLWECLTSRTVSLVSSPRLIKPIVPISSNGLPVRF